MGVPELRPFTIGGVIRRTFATLGRALPGLIGLALALNLLPYLLGVALAFALTDPAAPAIVLPALTGVLMATSVVHRGAAIGIALPTADGGRRLFGAALKGGAAVFVPNAAILVLVWLGVGLASCLVLVPGAMLLCRWVAAVPAEIVERPGVHGALARSRDLTKGHRWRIFGLLALYSVPGGVAPFLLLFQNPQGSSVDKSVIAVTAVVVGAAVNMVGQVGVAVIYAELRGAREGATSSEIVEAFG